MHIPTGRNRAQWDLAELTRECNGLLDRPAHSPDFWMVPLACALKDEVLVFEPSCRPVDPSRLSSRAVLEELVAIQQGDSAAVLRFAERWGPLYPTRSEAAVESEKLAMLAFAVGFGSLRRGEWVNFNHVAVYYIFAEHVRSILNQASRIYRTDELRIEWDKEEPYHCEGCPWGVDRARNDVARKVDRMLAGNANVAIEWFSSSPSPSVKVEAANLVGLIGIQLALTVSRGTAVYNCAGCKNLYFRAEGERTPKHCAACRQNEVPRKNAKLRWRQKVVEIQRRARDGESETALAAAYNTTAQKIRKYTSGDVKL